MTLRPAEEGSDNRVDLTKADFDKGSIRLPDTTTFARFHLTQ